MLKHTKGNLLDLAEKGKFDIIVHGCNCFNTMGSGIAKEIRERYPEAFEADERMDQEFGKNYRYLKLGNFSQVNVYPANGKFTIVNAYTQFYFNKKDEEFNDHFEYDSFNLILQKLLHFYGNYDFGFPYIGMGLAGGDKDRIIAMLEDFAEKISAQGGSVTLVEFG